jgi:hypothetical protein
MTEHRDENEELAYQEIQGRFANRGLYLRVEQGGDGWIAYYGNRESADVQGSGTGPTRLAAAREALTVHEQSDPST